MRRGGRLPDDQAEITFSDVFVEQLEELTKTDARDVLTDVVELCEEPSGKHPLSKALAGWNTISVLGGHKRVVYKASDSADVGLIEVLCLGPRSDSEVYDMAVGLVDTGLLDADVVTQLWEALTLLDVVAEKVGLDGWDYRPEPAPAGMILAAVTSGLLSEPVASLLSKDEIDAALSDGWDSDGPNPDKAIRAALDRARNSIAFPGDRAVLSRAEERCGAAMPRARTRCIRVLDHPGPHRST